MEDRKMKNAEELKLLEEGNQIIEEFDNDPDMKDVQAPDKIYDRLQRQIREFEEFKSCVSLSKEDKELIRLGKLYKKKRRQNLYITLAAVLVLVFGICTSSMGGVSEVLSKIAFWLEGEEYIVLDEGDGSVQPERNLSESEAFNQIEDTWGFYPVCFGYRSEGMQFYEFALMKGYKIAILTYQVGEEGLIFYDICPNYGTSAIGSVKDDECVGTYEIEVNGTSVTIAEFVEETTQSKCWDAYFTYKDVWYQLSFINMEESEVQKMVKNIIFN